MAKILTYPCFKAFAETTCLFELFELSSSAASATFSIDEFAELKFFCFFAILVNLGLLKPDNFKGFLVLKVNFFGSVH